MATHLWRTNRGRAAHVGANTFAPEAAKDSDECFGGSVLSGHRAALQHAEEERQQLLLLHFLRQLRSKHARCADNCDHDAPVASTVLGLQIKESCPQRGGRGGKGKARYNGRQVRQ